MACKKDHSRSIGFEEGVEIVVIEAGRLTEQHRGSELACKERQYDGDAVQRRDRQHAGHDPGADQVGDRPNRHRFQCVDLFADPHGAQLRGHAGAEGGRQADPGDDRRQNADVDESRQEAGERFDADIAQRAVTLHRENATGGQCQEADDDDGPADHRQSSCTHADFGDKADDFARIASDREGYAGQRSAVEQRVVADRIEGADRPAPRSQHAEGPRIGGSQRLHRSHGMSPTITSS